MLSCFVRKADGSVCRFLAHSDFYRPDGLDDLARLVTHLMEHISELTEKLEVQKDATQSQR